MSAKKAWLYVAIAALLSPAINASASGAAPTIDGVPPQRVIAGSQWYFQPSAQDTDGDELNYTIVNKPPWATFWPGLGRLFGTPAAADVGVHGDIVIRVHDGINTVEMATFSITVDPWGISPNEPPTISGIPTEYSDVNRWYRYQVAADDGDDHALTFAIQNKPSWASFSTTRGTLYGRPTAADEGSSTDIVISVSDGKDSASTAPFSILVNNTVSNSEVPTISANLPARGVVGSLYWTKVQASDADGDPLTFTINGKPPWMTFWSGSGRLFGTPSASDIGVHGQIAIEVTDGTNTAALPEFSIHVDPSSTDNLAPEISGAPKNNIDPDKWYNFLPTATDADGHALRFEIRNKPSWARFNTNTGRLNGRPGLSDTAVYADIRILVTDGIATGSLPAFAISVGAAAATSITLSWTPPVLNNDGTSLTNLAGYRIYYGTAPGSYPNSIAINNPDISSYVVENLQQGMYYFVTTAVNSFGSESDYSNMASALLQ